MAANESKNGPIGREHERESLARRNGWACAKCGQPFTREDIAQTLCPTCTYQLYYD
jgi:rubrerythrin